MARLRPQPRPWQDEKRQHRHRKPCRRGAAGPPHVKGGRRQQIAERRERQFDGKPQLPARQRRKSDQAEAVHRRVRQKTELLIEQQRGKTCQHVRGARLRRAAVRRRRIEGAVQRVKKPEPGDRADRWQSQERQQIPASLGRRDQSQHQEQSERGRDDGKARVQPRQKRQRGAGGKPPGPAQARRHRSAGCESRARLQQCHGRKNHERHAEPIRINSERFEEKRHRQRPAGPGKPGGAGALCQSVRAPP